MLICLDCKEVFSADDLAETYEFHGDYREKFTACPVCGGDDIVDAIKCPECGEWYSYEDNSHMDMCDKCVEEYKFLYRYDANKCFELSKDEKRLVEINDFLTSQFTVDEIERILLNELSWEQRTPYSDYINFIEEDEDWFVSKVAKGGGTNEQTEVKQG